MMYLLLFALVVLFAVLWFKERGRADLLDSRLQHAMGKANIAERKASGYREALEQSYIGLQALAEKSLELEWIRKDPSNFVQPGVWVGDEFHEVDMADGDEREVGQPVAQGEAPLPREEAWVKPYEWKDEMP